MKFLNLLVLSILLLQAPVYGAGAVHTCVKSNLDHASTPDGVLERGGTKFTCTWVADDTTALIPDAVITVRGFSYKVVTNPGATAPTADYDITLEDPDDNALDAMGGLLADRDTAVTEQVYTNISNQLVYLNGAHNVAVSGNAVNSATGEIHIYVLAP